MVSLGHAKRLHRRVQLAAQLQQLFTLDATFADAGQVVAAQVVDARRPKMDAAAEPGAAPTRLSFPGTLPGLLTGLSALLALDLA